MIAPRHVESHRGTSMIFETVSSPLANRRVVTTMIGDPPRPMLDPAVPPTLSTWNVLPRLMAYFATHAMSGAILLASDILASKQLLPLRSQQRLILHRNFTAFNNFAIGSSTSRVNFTLGLLLVSKPSGIDDSRPDSIDMST